MWEMDYDKAANHWIEKDREAVKMEDIELKAKIDAFIEGHNTCSLATASSEGVRCTPIEYNYSDGCFYFFSEGGLRFRGLKENKHVGLAIYEPYSGFANLKSLQIEGMASMIEPFSDEYLKIMTVKKIPVETMKRLPNPMNLVKVIPQSFDYLDSNLKKEGYGSRQHLEM